MNPPKRRALVVGFKYYGRFLADLINEFSSDWQLDYHGAERLQTLRAMIAARSADAIVCFGGPGPNAALLEIARKRGIPIVVVWAGSDVLVARNDPHFLELLKRAQITNISDGPWLVDELRAIGIEATYVPVTAVRTPETLTPLPEKFSVLTYLPEPRRAFYGERTIYAVAREFPEVTFRVVGRGERSPVAPKNVVFLGHVDDMEQRIDDATVLLRLPEHDGKSMLVLETLARGRHVIWNYAFPGVRTAHHIAEACSALRDLYDAHRAGRLELNTQGYEVARNEFGRERLATGFLNVLQRVTAPRARAQSPRHDVAISGLPLFSAHLIAQAEEFVQGWRPHFMPTSARLEVLTSMWALLSADVWYSIGSPLGDRWIAVLAKLLRKPHVVHWVGSDISMLYRDKALRRYCLQPGVQHLAEVDWTIEELAQFGITAELAPLPPHLPASEVAPLPEQFTVLLYLPRSRGDFYGRREYERLMRAFAHEPIRFIVVGGGEFYAPPEVTVERLGWRSSLTDVYRRSTVLIRFTAHDGLSLMALEALTHGRHVLWSNDFPHVRQIDSYKSMYAAVSDLYAAHKAGTLQPQYEAASYVKETYDPERCLRRIAHAWDAARAIPMARREAMEAT